MILQALLAAVFAVTMSIMFNTRTRALPICFLGGAVARFSRELFTLLDVALPAATLAATATTTVIVLLLADRLDVGRVALVSAILPLGATLTVFETVTGALRVATVDDGMLEATAARLVRDAAKSFDVTLAIGLGVASGVAIVQLLRRRRSALASGSSGGETPPE